MAPLRDFNTAANTAQTQQPDIDQQANLFEADPAKGSSMADPLISVAATSMQKILLYGRLSQLVKLLPKILHLDLQPPSELPRCVLMEAAQS